MNITLLKLKGIVQGLKGIQNALERMADCWETELSQTGFNMRIPKTDTSGPEPTLSYVDEEMDFVRESIDRYQREDALKEKEDE